MELEFIRDGELETREFWVYELVEQVFALGGVGNIQYEVDNSLDVEIDIGFEKLDFVEDDCTNEVLLLKLETSEPKTEFGVEEFDTEEFWIEEFELTVIVLADEIKELLDVEDFELLEAGIVELDEVAHIFELKIIDCVVVGTPNPVILSRFPVNSSLTDVEMVKVSGELKNCCVGVTAYSTKPTPCVTLMDLSVVVENVAGVFLIRVSLSASIIENAMVVGLEPTHKLKVLELLLFGAE